MPTAHDAGRDREVSEKPASIPEGARALAARRLTGGPTSELQAEPRRQGIVTGILGVFARIGQAEVETVTQFVVQAEVRRRLLRSNSRPCRRRRCPSALIASAFRRSLPRSGAAPLARPTAALLPVPGRRQAPTQGQVAALLVRRPQAQAVVAQCAAVQAQQRQPGEGLQGEIAEIQGEAAFAEQLPAMRAGVIAATVQAMLAVEGAPSLKPSWL